MISNVKGKTEVSPDPLEYQSPGGLFTSICRHLIFLFGPLGRRLLITRPDIHLLY